MQRKTLLGGIAILLILVAVSAALYLNKRQTFHGAIVNPPAPVAEIQLTDQNGRPFRMSALRGKVVSLYFGYTNCPDECPLTMAHLKQASDILGNRAGDLVVVMVTTDPARDNQQVLKDWLAKFNPSFMGLYGTPEELGKVWKDYGIVVVNGGETHSDFIFVIDRNGNLRETFLPGDTPDDIAADLNILLSER